jgi:hypothetical protein
MYVGISSVSKLCNVHLISVTVLRLWAEEKEFWVPATGWKPHIQLGLHIVMLVHSNMDVYIKCICTCF